jgi:quinolinate synthase
MIKKDQLTNYERNIVEALSKEEEDLFLVKIPELLKEQNAKLISHYYTAPEIQLLAEKTSGIVSDSLEMARFGKECDEKMLVIAGVYFMAETAKILSPNKKVLITDKNATCSLDLSCPYSKFKEFVENNPGREVVVYANTSAMVRTLADWVVTSRNAVDIINHIQDQGKKILWAPDKYLGSYIQQKTKADMLLWQGECIVHAEFTSKKLLHLKNTYPDAAVLAHPESPMAVLEEADVIGSTTQLLKAACELTNKKFIVATDMGIFYKMQQMAPNKEFIPAPTANEGGSCQACAKCPWMGMNTIKSLYETLKSHRNQVELSDNIIKKASVPMQRMVNFNTGN